MEEKMKEILLKLEMKKITIEEAMKLLEELEEIKVEDDIKNIFIKNIKSDIYITSSNVKEIIVKGDAVERLKSNDKEIDILDDEEGEDVFIEIPKGLKVNISLKSVSGDISIVNIHGENLTINTRSGDAKVNYSSFKNVMLNSLSGDINMQDTSGDKIIKSTSGDIDIKLDKFDGCISSQSLSGDIVIYIPEKCEFAVKAKTLSGRVSTDFNLTYLGNKTNNSIRGKHISEKNVIDVVTKSGDIRVIKLI